MFLTAPERCPRQTSMFVTRSWPALSGIPRSSVRTLIIRWAVRSLTDSLLLPSCSSIQGVRSLGLSLPGLVPAPEQRSSTVVPVAAVRSTGNARLNLLCASSSRADKAFLPDGNQQSGALLKSAPDFSFFLLITVYFTRALACVRASAHRPKIKHLHGTLYGNIL